MQRYNEEYIDGHVSTTEVHKKAIMAAFIEASVSIANEEVRYVPEHLPCFSLNGFHA